MANDPRESAEQRTLLLPRAEQAGVLPPSHSLQEFVLQKLISRSPYNLICLARDERLDRYVAIKEFLPTMLEMRGRDLEVLPRLPRFAQAFDKGLQGFMQEARLLGSFEHPALLQVFRYWTETGTAYMAMPFYDGITLRKWLNDLGTPPSEAWLRDLLRPLMQALQPLFPSFSGRHRRRPGGAARAPAGQHAGFATIAGFGCTHRCRCYSRRPTPSGHLGLAPDVGPARAGRCSIAVARHAGSPVLQRLNPDMTDTDHNTDNSSETGSETSSETSSDTRPPLPDHLSTNPRSPHHNAGVLAHDIGVRFNGQERKDVEEYCISQGWVRVAAGRTLDRKGQPMMMQLKGTVEVFYR